MGTNFCGLLALMTSTTSRKITETFRLFHESFQPLPPMALFIIVLLLVKIAQLFIFYWAGIALALLTSTTT